MDDPDDEWAIREKEFFRARRDLVKNLLRAVPIAILTILVLYWLAQ